MTIPAERAASLEDIDISGELQSRPAGRSNRRVETKAMYLLAGALRESLPIVLKRLATLAIELCGAGSGGVSVIEDSETGPLFRWQALAGEVERFEGGSTPRDWSPRGSLGASGGREEQAAERIKAESGAKRKELFNMSRGW